MSKYMLLIVGEPTNWSTLSPERQQAGMEAYMAFSKKLREEGRHVDAEGLIDTAKSIRPGKTGPIVSDGPYVESKEIVGGYYIFTAESWEEALEISQGCPALQFGSGMELRRVMEY